MAKEYVHEQGGGYLITDTRVSLDSVVYCVPARRVTRRYR